MKTSVNGTFVKPSARMRNVAKVALEDGAVRNKPTSEEYVKQILSWASVSYAFGFVIVTVHTARLGLPVIELLHPIYVWVGLPIALVLFFSSRIAALSMRASDRAAKEIRLGLMRTRSPAVLDESQLMEDMTAAAQAIPFFLGSAFIVPAILRLIGLKDILAAQRAGDPVAFQRSALSIRRIAGFARAFGAAWSIASLVAYLLYLLLLLGVYVYSLYPEIPQSYGGGKPVTAYLVVEETALPDGVLALSERKAGSTGDKADKLTALLPVTLLYATKDAYYVRVASGVKMSIKADTVKSVVWDSAVDSAVSRAGSSLDGHRSAGAAVPHHAR